MKTNLQGLQSTKSDEITPLQESLDFFLPSDRPNVKTNQVCYALIDRNYLTTAYMDLTGRFPKRSSRGNQYVLVGYHYDSNHIHGIPIKIRKGEEITNAWQDLHYMYSKAGVAPEMMVLDNEFSADLKTAFDEHNLSYQLVTPYKHKNNLAERAIKTWKSHFKAGLAGTDPDFPMAEWDLLIHQSNITLNLLRSSRVNPKLSAYAYIHGPFNFLSTPMASPGTRVIVHMHPEKRASWELNGQHGWYVVPALNHYRFVKVYIPRTKAIITSDAVEFFPHSVTFPQVKLHDYLKQAASDIVSILATPPSTTVPTLASGDETQNAILQLASILKRADKIRHLQDMTDKPLPRVIKPIVITSPIATNHKDIELNRPPSMIL